MASSLGVVRSQWLTASWRLIARRSRSQWRSWNSTFASFGAIRLRLECPNEAANFTGVALHSNTASSSPSTSSASSSSPSSPSSASSSSSSPSSSSASSSSSSSLLSSPLSLCLSSPSASALPVSSSASSSASSASPPSLPSSPSPWFSSSPSPLSLSLCLSSPWFSSSSLSSPPFLQVRLKSTANSPSVTTAAVGVTATNHNDVKIDDIEGIKQNDGVYVFLFTCNKCNTRAAKKFSKAAYHNGIVIVRCSGCQNLHLVSDQLGWFGETTWTIESILKQKGVATLRSMEGSQLIDASDVGGIDALVPSDK